MNYFPRVLEKRLKTVFSTFPAVAITGPRQSGKTTLARHLDPDIDYVTFDDPTQEISVKQDPAGFLNRWKGPVIFDEVQRVPELLRYIKMVIDEDPDKKGRFILTGSNQFSLFKGLSETLAGRVALLELLPMELLEMPMDRRADRIVSGSYPVLVKTPGLDSREWYASYFRTYLERDIRMVLDIGKLSEFQRFVQLLALRTAQEWNASSMARELGISAHTADAWLSALEAGYVVFRLHPYHRNSGKRLIKRPKVYFWDTGLVCHLTGQRSMEIMNEGPLKGALFENHVIAEIFKRIKHTGRQIECTFFRDNNNLEVDLILEEGFQTPPRLIEIKAGATIKAQWLEGARKVGLLLSEKAQGSVLYQGITQKDYMGPGMSFMNWADWLEEFALEE